MIHIKDNGHVRSDPDQAFDEVRSPLGRRTLTDDHEVEVVRGVSHELEDGQTGFRSHDFVPGIPEKVQEGPRKILIVFYQKDSQPGGLQWFTFCFLISVDYEQKGTLSNGSLLHIRSQQIPVRKSRPTGERPFWIGCFLLSSPILTHNSRLDLRSLK